MVPRHWSTSEGHDTTGPDAAVVVVAASVVVSAFDVVKEVRKVVSFDSVVLISAEVALEAVDSAMLVSTVVSARVVDSITVTLAEPVLLATEKMELERLSGLHFPAEAMPAAAEKIKKERMATMVTVRKQDEW
jgi:hypothetical protein